MDVLESAPILVALLLLVLVGFVGSGVKAAPRRWWTRDLQTVTLAFAGALAISLVVLHEGMAPWDWLRSHLNLLSRLFLLAVTGIGIGWYIRRRLEEKPAPADRADAQPKEGDKGKGLLQGLLPRTGTIFFLLAIFLLFPELRLVISAYLSTQGIVVGNRPADATTRPATPTLVFTDPGGSVSLSTARDAGSSGTFKELHASARRISRAMERDKALLEALDPAFHKAVFENVANGPVFFRTAALDQVHREIIDKLLIPLFGCLDARMQETPDYQRTNLSLIPMRSAFLELLAMDGRQAPAAVAEADWTLREFAAAVGMLVDRYDCEGVRTSSVLKRINSNEERSAFALRLVACRSNGHACLRDLPYLRIVIAWMLAETDSRDIAVTELRRWLGNRAEKGQGDPHRTYYDVRVLLEIYNLLYLSPHRHHQRWILPNDRESLTKMRHLAEQILALRDLKKWVAHGCTIAAPTPILTEVYQRLGLIMISTEASIMENAVELEELVSADEFTDLVAYADALGKCGPALAYLRGNPDTLREIRIDLYRVYARVVLALARQGSSTEKPPAAAWQGRLKEARRGIEDAISLQEPVAATVKKARREPAKMTDLARGEEPRDKTYALELLQNLKRLHRQLAAADG